MLSLEHLEVAVTEKDIARMLRSARGPGVPDVRDVQFGYGEARLQLTLPGLISLPVDVTVAVDGWRDGELHLRLAWTNLALLPAAVKQAGLGRAVAALGLGEFWDGHGGLAIPLIYMQARLAASFDVERLELTPDRLLIRLRKLQAVSPELVRGSAKRDSGAAARAELAEPEHASTRPDAVPPPAAAVSLADSGRAGAAPSDDSVTDDTVTHAASDDGESGDAAADAMPFDAQERRRYDEWRQRLLQWSRSKLPPSLQAALPWVLLVPDLSVLLGRMLLDQRLSPTVRTLLGAVLVYALSPIDLVPDPIPVAGGIDDLALILLTLSQLQRQGHGELVQEHWSGDGEPVRVIADGLQFLRRRFRNVLRMMQRHKVRLRRRSR